MVRVTDNVHGGKNLQLIAVDLVFPFPHHNGGQPIVPVDPAHRFLQRLAIHRDKQRQSVLSHRLRPQSVQILARPAGQRVVFVPEKGQDLLLHKSGQRLKRNGGTGIEQVAGVIRDLLFTGRFSTRHNSLLSSHLRLLILLGAPTLSQEQGFNLNFLLKIPM